MKSFDQPLNQAVRARIGAIEPQRSTRMGAALRQAIGKLRSVASRARHLILLSDGFPQDFDYGEDRRSNVYGLRDTTMALREAAAAGVQTFCITVDRAGHDYLREMCDAKRYLVIEDIAALPRELPKIYSEATRDAWAASRGSARIVRPRRGPTCSCSRRSARPKGESSSRPSCARSRRRRPSSCNSASCRR